MNLPAGYAVPDDLDRARYIAEAHEILKEIGHREKKSLWQHWICASRKINKK
jgi:hypothetical protein